jgi:UDP-N-acetylmuramate dehydrogenase
MQVSNNISLKPYNSFGIDARAKLFGRFSSVDELAALTEDPSIHREPLLILGGGSNILFRNDFNGLVLKNELKGIELTGEDPEYYYVRANAGENWHGFVEYCLAQNYAGIENLSLIPGNVGASPMQNIGAYGVEIKDVFHDLEAWHLQERVVQKFTLAACGFGYRESVFKKQYKGQFVILNVTFRLRKQPVYHTHYGAIEQELAAMGVKELSIQKISQAVTNIRTSKLPDPKIIGNAGSFFKNPVITQAQFDALKNEFPSLPGYPAAGQQVKTAAGWLIEQCGWKGFRKGDAGCYDKQALVLVNYGHASGDEIFSLSQSIINSVQEKFGIVIEREVNII